MVAFSFLLSVLAVTLEAVKLHGVPSAFLEHFDFYGYKTRLVEKSSRSHSVTLVEKGIHLDPPSILPYSFQTNSPENSHAQYGQDKILWNLLSSVKDGFFVESGARDGESHSNSIFFEMRGWQGLLVEPGQEYGKIASKHRKCHTFHGAISPTGTSATLEFEDSADGLSTLGSVGEEAKQEMKQAGSRMNKFQVQAEPLQDILAAVGQKRTVDFWSLDVEGSEAPILETTDFTKIEVGLLLIEMNKGEDNNRRIVATMQKNGFRDIGRTKYPGGFLDHVFINPKYFEARGISVPATVPGLY